MAFFNGLFALLSVIFFICLIVALIKPSIFKIKTRLKAFLIFFTAMIVSSLIVNATMSDEERARIEQQQTASEAKSSPEQPVQENTPIVEDKKSVEETPKVEVQEVVEEVQSLTRPQSNAVRSASQYLSMSGFSRKGLIDQLSSSYGDGYDKADATIAVDSLNVDWNEQAARSAAQYLEMSGFSCNGLIDQLSSSAGDKYTKDQATYGAQQAGACS